MDQGSLVIFTQASRMLAEANTIQKAHELKNLALTAADWARRKGMGEEAVQHARSYAKRAELRMGEMLTQTERAKGTDKGGRQYVDGDRALPSNAPPTLAELGLTKRESAEAQALASLPEEKQEAIIDGTLTLLAAKKELHHQRVSETIKKFPAGKFRVVYADPPWKYGDDLDMEHYGPAVRHYPSMTISELCALPVKDLATDDAVLFLWVTSPLLAECWPVIRAWGFAYKACFVWDKEGHNFGHYNSVRHEFLLICTRGSCLPDSKKLEDSVQSIQKTREHSRKPEEFRGIIDAMYPNGPRVELFARGEVPLPWVAWGNE